MNSAAKPHAHKAVDAIQHQLAEYASNLQYDRLSPEAIHQAKVRIIDTLGSLVAGFDGDSCRIVRNLAAQMTSPNGATIIGTKMKTSPEMAALVNAVTGRYVEMMDIYHYPGAYGGHPSDVTMPVLAAAEHARASGRELITAVVLAYEVFLRVSDVFHNKGFDDTNFACLATAVAAGKLLRLSGAPMENCISMAAVPNVILRQVRMGHISMWKVVAAGYAGRAGVFSAMLARAGMEGPHLPFEGKAGWCAQVAGEPLTLNVWGGGKTPFKILDTRIKNRPSAGESISSILAAEKIAKTLKDIDGIKQVSVELYKRALERAATGEAHWNPESRDAADHSVPYVVAATLVYGTVTTGSFDDDHLWNPRLRTLLKKIEAVENAEFTNAYPAEHRTRITVVTADGNKIVAESGGDEDDLSAPKSDAQIVEKFRGLAQNALGAEQVDLILNRLWRLEDMPDVAAIPPYFDLA